MRKKYFRADLRLKLKCARLLGFRKSLVIFWDFENLLGIFEIFEVFREILPGYSIEGFDGDF